MVIYRRVRPASDFETKKLSHDVHLTEECSSLKLRPMGSLGAGGLLTIFGHESVLSFVLSPGYSGAGANHFRRSSMSIQLRLTAFAGTQNAMTPGNDEFITIGERTVDETSKTSIMVLVEELFPDVLPDDPFHRAPEPNNMRPFALYVTEDEGPASRLRELERITMWDAADGRVHFPPLGLVTGHLSVADIIRSHEARYVHSLPRVVYVVPLQGLGSAGDLLLQFFTELFFFGASWVASDALPSPKAWLKTYQLTKRARRVAEDFSARGVRHTAEVRAWAESRESWTTFEAAKRLGVDHDVMETIFTALGYRKRYEDQTWRQGETEEYRRLRQAWIDGEPARNQVTPFMSD
ncbi:hypothetical protein [Leucobacter manosquensis]|uniref:Uncharacterized protein n=1 Tax=Leucobacter manosquensis TaxID=2810611 RepID=A0ABS5M407_9MICO|nr:hypothetical protein [Leucobacter manosquensis]MBS3181933.1 hypothetical protein [Leucobacter manosquensis]